MIKMINRFGCLLIISIVMFYGCSSGSDAGKVFVAESGGHPENWVNPSSIGTKDFHGSSVNISYSTPRGYALYSLRCEGCHAEAGAGDIGPDIRGKTANEIKSSFNSVIYMQWLGRFSTDEEIQAIADYLSNTITTSTYTVDASICSACHGEDFNGDITKIGCYSCHKGPDGTVGHPAGWRENKSNSVHFHGYYAQSFEIACTTCHGSDLRGPIVPSCYSCHGTCDGENCAPVADAGSDQAVVVGSLVTLDGTGSSDVNGDSLTYSWLVTSKPAGSSATLSDPTAAKPTFTSDIAGLYVISLVVNDGKTNSEADTVTITASSQAATVVHVTLASFTITSDLTTFYVNTPYSFVITNNANIPHEWMIMPVGDTNPADALVSTGTISPGATVTVNYTFTKTGQFEMACHLTGHYEAGMKLAITVQ